MALVPYITSPEKWKKHYEAIDSKKNKSREGVFTLRGTESNPGGKQAEINIVSDLEQTIVQNKALAKEQKLEERGAEQLDKILHPTIKSKRKKVAKSDTIKFLNLIKSSHSSTGREKKKKKTSRQGKKNTKGKTGSSSKKK